MKTAVKFHYLLFCLYASCGMGVSSEIENNYQNEIESTPPFLENDANASKKEQYQLDTVGSYVTGPNSKTQKPILIHNAQNVANNNAAVQKEGIELLNSTKSHKPFTQTQTTLVAKSVRKTSTINNTTIEPATNSFRDNKNNSTSNNEISIKIKALNIQESYQPSKSHTLLIEIENGANTTPSLKLDVQLPEHWNIVTMNDIGVLNEKQKKIILLSFNIPANQPAGENTLRFTVKTNTGSTINSKELKINVAKNFELEVFNLFTSSKLQAGETIVAKYEIKNKGNVEQEITISSKSTIIGATILKIQPNSSVIIETNQKTDSKYYDFLTVGTFLNVTNNASGQSYKAYGTTQIFPSKLKQEDAFFRFPVRFSLNYNSNTFQEQHFSTLSAEIIGDGFLDVQKKNYLSFIIRAPQQQTLKNFGITDQYSLVYNHNNKTIIYLGDHGHFINRLGFDSRFGMGFRIDQRVKKWNFITFFSKPRLYTFNSEALYGSKSTYNISKNMLIGLAIESSKGTIQGANPNIEANVDERGQIITSNYEYRGKNTFLNAESSLSITNKNTDFAHYFNVLQKVKNFTYTGTVTYSGRNYFGNIRNSMEYSNSLFYKLKKFDMVIGQTLSQVNKRLNPLFFAAEPYFENYFARIGYRFDTKNYITLMADKRVREDQLLPKSYFYEETGIDYRYLFTGRTLTFSFTGRIADTKNLLSNDLSSRTTYSHNLETSYRFSSNISGRGGVTHIYSNRYGTSNLNDNFYTYSLGIDVNVNKDLRFNATYNSGFSPEYAYLRRDFINANLLLSVAKRHLFELRANYFENPGQTNKRELLAFGTYTYSFGVPLKRILEQGGINGAITTNDKTISIKGIRIMAAGKSIVSDENGLFELNNIPLGNNFIVIDEATLPFGIVTLAKTPFQVTVEKGKLVNLPIEIARGGTLIGTFILNDYEKTSKSTLEGYVKMTNENFNYTIESNAKGQFKFQNIVPGTYKIQLVRHKGQMFFEQEKEIQIAIAPGDKKIIEIKVKGKERKVQFKNKNFKVGG